MASRPIANGGYRSLSPEPEMNWTRSDGGVIYPTSTMVRTSSNMCLGATEESDFDFVSPVPSRNQSFTAKAADWICATSTSPIERGFGEYITDTSNPSTNHLSSQIASTGGMFRTGSAESPLPGSAPHFCAAEEFVEVPIVETDIIPEGRIITFSRDANAKAAPADDVRAGVRETSASSTQALPNADKQTSAVMYPGAVALEVPVSWDQPNGPKQDVMFLVGGYRRSGHNPSGISKFYLNQDGSVERGPLPVDLAQCDINTSAPLLQHQVVAVQETYCVYIIGNGGDDEDTQGNSLFCYDIRENTVTRVAITQKGNPELPAVIPKMYHCHTSVLMKCPETKHPLIVSFGGVQENQPLSALFIFDTVTKTWERKAAAKIRPVARLYHAGCSDGAHTMYIYGGAPDCKTTTANDVIFGDMWSWDIRTNLWKLIRPLGPKPTPRGSCCLQYKAPFIYLLGGFNGSEDFSDFSRYDCSSQAWTKLESAAECASGKNGVWAYGSCVFKDCLYYLGGICKREAGVELADCALSETIYTYKPAASGLKQLLARFCADHELVPRLYDPNVRNSLTRRLTSPYGSQQAASWQSADSFTVSPTSTQAPQFNSRYDSTGSLPDRSRQERRTPGGPPQLSSLPSVPSTGGSIGEVPSIGVRPPSPL